ncbi:MAG: aldehyde ferredoxin oxidoreductase family protein [Anaerolineae bacterium]
MAFGYTGKILRVDLTSRTIDVETRGDEFYRRFLGGRGLVGYYLLSETRPGIDALSPENLLIFAAGPLTGAALSGQGRNGVGAKSPLTNGFGNAEGGGYFGAELKRAGFDAVILTGQAERPVYLWVNNGAAELRDASHLWGKTTGQVEDLIRAELNDKGIRTALIGPAGENRVRFAAIVHDRSHFAGRSGLGAVMGSKNLKGVAVRAKPGKGLMEIAHPDHIQGIARWMGANLDLISGLHDAGTARIVRSLSKAGGLPTRNFREGVFAENEAITGTTMRDQILIKRETCYACAVRCKRVVEVKQPPASVQNWNLSQPYVHPQYGGPEYETLAAFGSDEGISDLVALAKANELCAAYGIDTISMGAVIAFAMEAFEQELISARDTDGIDLRFGNAAAMLQMVDKITRREGLGDVLADGVARAADKIGGGAAAYAMHVHGQEIPMHEPRLKHGLGIGYVVSPTGADHEHNMHDTYYVKQNDMLKWLQELDERLHPLPANDLSADKVRLLVAQTNWMHFWDSAVMCHFLPYSTQQMTEMTNAVTGWDLGAQDYLRIGERAATLARVYNLREGWNSEGDRLPARFFEKLAGGPLANVSLPQEQFDNARKEYYTQMGWDESGVPTPERLQSLGIAKVATG